MSTETEQFDQLPDAVIEALQARDRRVGMLTPEVDATIAAAARAQFESRISPSRSSTPSTPMPASAPSTPRPLREAAVRQWRYPAAAAAAVALVALLIVRPFGDDVPVTLELADDIDGSGQIDVLDAFALARVRAGDPGAISEERIDELMRQIVSVGDAGGVL